MSRCVKVNTLGRLCNDDLGRLYNHFTTTNIYLIGATYNSYFLIIYKPLSLIISPWTFSTQLGAGTAWFCLSQCAIPFCTLSPSEGDVRKVPVIQRAAFCCILFNSLMFLMIEAPLKNQRLNLYNAMGKMHVLYRSRFCMGSMLREELSSIFMVLRVERHLVA